MNDIDFRYYSELYHHGILGMHWGIRRFQNKDGSLTGAGRKRYDVGSKRDSSKDKILSDQEVINIGNSAILDYGKKKAIEDYMNLYIEKSSNLSTAKKADGTSYSEKEIHNLSIDYAEKEIENKYSYKVLTDFGENCPNCALAVELRKRGIEAKPKATGGMSGSQIHELYVGEKTKNCSYNSDFFNSKNYGPPGSHGQILGAYSNGGGHTFNYTVLPNGDIQIEDAQTGKVWHSLTEVRTDPEYGMLNYLSYGQILNLTNAEIDMDWARQMDMIDTSSPKNGNDIKLRQYEDKVRSYIKGTKAFETATSLLTKGVLKTLVKKAEDKIKGLFKKKK